MSCGAAGRPIASFRRRPAAQDLERCPMGRMLAVFDDNPAAAGAGPYRHGVSRALASFSRPVDDAYDVHREQPGVRRALRAVGHWTAVAMNGLMGVQTVVAIARSSPPREDAGRRGFRSRGTRRSAGLRPASHRLSARCPGRRRAGRRGPARGQAGARFEHAAFDRSRNSASDLLGERRLGGAVDVQVQGLRHAAVVHYSFAFLVLFPAQQKAIFRAAEGESP
jgi:hypothetical protein